MIQRPQSVYLALVTISFLLLPFLPIAHFFGNGAEIDFSLFKAVLKKDGTETIASNHFWMGVIDGLIGALAAYTIFQFKNRKFQIKLTGALFVLIGAFIVLEYFLQENLVKTHAMVSKNYLMGTYLPLLALVFCFMAQRGIKKDEELVRSADRLR